MRIKPKGLDKTSRLIIHLLLFQTKILHRAITIPLFIPTLPIHMLLDHMLLVHTLLHHVLLLHMLLVHTVLSMPIHTFLVQTFLLHTHMLIQHNKTNQSKGHHLLSTTEDLPLMLCRYQHLSTRVPIHTLCPLHIRGDHTRTIIPTMPARTVATTTE